MKDLDTQHGTIAFKALGDLIPRADAAAKREGLTRSDIARRALIRDLERLERSGQDAAA